MFTLLLLIYFIDKAEITQIKIKLFVNDTLYIEFDNASECTNILNADLGRIKQCTSQWLKLLSVLQKTSL